MIYKRLYFIGLIYLLALPLQGQGLSFYEYYSSKTYDFHPQNWDIVQDSSGYLIFANQSGYLAFNGVHWKKGHIGEFGRGISLHKSNSRNKIYAGTSDGIWEMVSDSLNQIEFKNIASSDDSVWSFSEIWQIHEINSEIHFRHRYGFFILDEDDKISHYPAPGRLHTSFALGDSIIVRQNGVGLLSFKNKKYRFIKGTEAYADDPLYLAFRNKEDKLLLGARNALFRSYEDGILKEYDQYDAELANKSFYKILPLQDKWVTANLTGGITFLSEDLEILNYYDETNVLPVNRAFNVYEDSEKNIWGALDNGIIKINASQPLYQFKEVDGIVTAIQTAGDNLWVGSTEGVYMGNIHTILENGFQKIEELTGQVQDIYYKNNQVLISMSHGPSDGLYRYNQSSLTKISDIVFTDITEIDARRSIGISSNNLYEITSTGNQFVISEYQKGLDFEFDKINHWNNKLILIEYHQGLFQQASDHVGLEKIEVPNSKDYLNHVSSYKDNLLIASDGGLFQLNTDNLVEQIKGLEHEYLQDKQVFHTESCANGDLWLVASQKVIHAKKLKEGWATKTSPFHLIGEGETINTIHCTDDGVWFGGNAGLYFLENSEWNYETDFKTNITGILVKNDSLIYGGFGEPAKNIILPYKDNELRFTYAAASYISPKDNTYQVKLEGFDSDWSDWTLETQKDYTNIPEGHYSFKVRSKNVYEVAGMTDVISFSVLPPWYRTWWAYLLYTVTIAGIFYLAYKIRVNQILRVYRIRNSIASDLHDEVSATLSSISYFAQAIESDAVNADKNRFVKLISDSAGDAKEKISDIVWAINPEHDEWKTFLSKCRRYASDLLESKDIKYSLKIVEDIPGTLDMRLRQQLWLIFKEMATNAARHSEAKQVDVIMSYEHGKLKLVVQDDGIGMDVDNIQKGNGLVNINQRADEINGKITLTSEPGFGSRWALIVPI